jgi:deoxyribodipyrimidine photo-lyase
MTPTLVWFRNDLRLADNPALAAAVDRGGPVIPVFIWPSEEEEPWFPGAASRWWLNRSLASLNADLEGRGSRLIIRRGPAEKALTDLVNSSGATAVYWNRRYEPSAIAHDRTLKKNLRDRGITTESFNGSLLFEPWTIRNGSGQAYRVFTPYWRACRNQAIAPMVSHAPSQLHAPQVWPPSLPLPELDLEPKLDWTSGLQKAWQPGEAGAMQQLQRFREEAVNHYSGGRDRPAETGTSRLSPHLHFGEISARQVRQAILEIGGPESEVYLRQVGWREFAHHVLYHQPQSPNQPLRREFAAFPWKHDSKSLSMWQQGKTGYPLVDAGMRELWQTGWMHNRVRMVVASFLVKHLLIDWQEGASWFWDTLVDADLANNTLGWQWAAGCGADAAPYFRIFNPVLQGEKFDPAGAYVRRWVPELAALPDAFIHKPWEAPESILGTAGVALGRTYPNPIIDQATARARALAALGTMRKERVAVFI